MNVETKLETTSTRPYTKILAERAWDMIRDEGAVEKVRSIAIGYDGEHYALRVVLEPGGHVFYLYDGDDVKQSAFLNSVARLCLAAA